MCIGCGHVEYGIDQHITDGVRCEKCQDTLVPIRTLERYVREGNNCKQ